MRVVSCQYMGWLGAEMLACFGLQAANVLINHDGRVVLSDFGVTANLERATPSSLRRISHSQASTSDAPGVPAFSLWALPHAGESRQLTRLTACTASAS